MKPFVAVTVLVAASLTAASAAPSQQLQQQLAAGSQGSGLRQRPSSSSGLQSVGGSPGFGSVWSFGPSLGGGAFGPAYFGFGSGQGSGLGASPSGSPGLSSAGGAGSQLGSAQVQAPFGGRNGYGPYQGFWGSNYYPSQGYGYGQTFYGPSYGIGAGWGYNPVYGSSQWPLVGNGYGGGFGTFYPGASAYGGFSSSAQGSAGVGQLQAALPGARRHSAGGSSQQSLSRRQ